jgi:alpha-1,6-mannosyltransferase
MKFCDITIAYNEKSGGIRTYIDAKRRFLRDHTDHEHVLIIPGEENSIMRNGPLSILRVAGPLLPNQGDYRFFLSPGKIKDALAEEQPDVVELGSYYMEPWAAFSYRRRRRESGKTCLVGGYFHTDVAEAYVAAPLRAAAHSWLDDFSETLGSAAEKLADIVGSGADHYMRSVFQNCDLAFAAAPVQATRLQDYDLDNIHVVPMGVDLDLFHPNRRDQAIRARQGAGPGDLVLLYAGRFCTEKRVMTVIDAFRRLPRTLKAHLWMVGDGPLREDVEAMAADDPRLVILPYEDDREAFANLFASADLYVTAGPFETFGISVLEAQASGLPLIGVDAGALRQRASDGLGYLGPVDDAQAMAANIVKAARQRARVGPRVRRHVVENFSWDSAFETWLDAYARQEQSPVTRPQTLSEISLQLA